MLEIGAEVVRMLCGTIPMRLKITNIDDKYIYCGDWKFDKITGIEIDEELGWNNNGTGSYIEI